MFPKRLSYCFLFSLILLFVVPLHAQDGVSLPATRAVITPENVAQLQPLGRFGTGELSDAFAWTPDESTLAIGGATGIWLYASDALTTPSDFIPTERYVDRLGFSPDGQYLAYRTRGDIVHLLDYATRTELQVFEDAQAFTFHPEMPLFAVGTDHREVVEEAGEYNISRVTLWDIEAHETFKTVDVRADQWGGNTIVNLDFSADGSLFAAAWQSGEYSTCGDRASEVIWWNFDDILNHTEAELNHYESQFDKYLPHRQYGVKFHPSKNVLASARVGDLPPYPVTILLDIYDPLTEELTTYNFAPQSYKSIVTFDFDATGDQVHALVGNNRSWGDEVFTLNLSDGTVGQDTRFSGWITVYAPLPYPTSVTSGQYHIAQNSDDLVEVGGVEVWSPNSINDAGSAFLTQEIDGTWRLWTLDESEGVEEIALPANYQGWIPRFIPGGQIIKLDAGEDERRFALWNFSAGTSFEFDATTLRDDWSIVDFSANGGRMAVQRTDGRIEIYDTSTGTWLSTLNSDFEQRVQIAFRPDGSHLTTVHFLDTGDSNTSTVELREWSSDTGELSHDYGDFANSSPYPYHDVKMGSVEIRYSSDGERLSLQSSYVRVAEHTQEFLAVQVFDVNTGEAVFIHLEENAAFKGGLFSDDFQYYALDIGDWSRTDVELYDTERNALIVGDYDYIHSSYAGGPWQFSPDNSHLIVGVSSYTGCGGDSRFLLLHDTETLAEVAEIRVGSAFMGYGSEHSSFTADSRMLMILTDSGAEFYDAESGEFITTIDGLDNSQLRFNADGTLLIAARDDGTVTLWGIPTDTAD